MKLLNACALVVGLIASNYSLACISAISEAKLFTVNLNNDFTTIEGETGDFIKFRVYAEGNGELTEAQIDSINAGKTSVADMTFLPNVSDPTAVLPHLDLFVLESLKVEQTEMVVSPGGGLGRQLFRQVYTVILSSRRGGTNTTLDGVLHATINSPNGIQAFNQKVKLVDKPMAKDLNYDCGG